MSPVPGCAQRIAKFLLSRRSLTARFGYLPRSGVKWTLCAAHSRVRGGVASVRWSTVGHPWQQGMFISAAMMRVSLTKSTSVAFVSPGVLEEGFDVLGMSLGSLALSACAVREHSLPELRNFCPFRPENWAADLASPPEWPQLDREPSRARHADSTLTCLTSCCCTR